jgi:hypothetical protein
MPPGALRSQVGLRTIAFAFRALEPSSAKTDMDINGFLLRQKLDFDYLPIGIKAQ